MMEKLINLTGICIILVLTLIPLAIAVDEANAASDMQYAEFNIDE